MTGIQFVRATKEKAKARIALDGPSGSGKTYTALRVATTLTPGSVAVLDTEHGSASKYADLFEFDRFEPDSYAPGLLIEALAVAGAAGFGTFVVDSLSHFWMGVDGMLEQVDRAAKRSAGGNTFGGWKEMAPVERRMIEAMLAYPGHVIATMRTKTEWVIEDNERGKKVPRRVGLKAQQRDGLEYEFDVVGDMNLDNELIVSKTRCPALQQQVIKEPGEEFAETIRGWLEAGTDPTDRIAAFMDEAAGEHTRASLGDLYLRIARGRLLDAGVLHPATGEPTTLGQYVGELGKAAKVAEEQALAARQAAEKEAAKAAEQPGGES